MPSTGRSQLDRAPCERDLEGVPLGHGADGLGVRRLSVGGGVDVGSAGEQQPVEQLQHLVGILDQAGVRWEHQRECACALQGVDVVARKQQGRLVPDAPASLLERGADADDGPFHAPHHRIKRAGRPAASRRRISTPAYRRGDS